MLYKLLKSRANSFFLATVIFMQLLSFKQCFGENPIPVFVNVNIVFTDGSIKPIYLENTENLTFADTPIIKFENESSNNQRILYYDSSHLYNVACYADTIYSLKQGNIEPLYFAAKRKFKIFDECLYIKNKKVNKIQYNLKEDDELQIKGEYISSLWNFIWVDSNDINKLQIKRIAFSKTFVDDTSATPKQFRAISLNPLITEELFSNWYFQSGLSNDFIINAQKNRYLIIIRQPID